MKMPSYVHSFLSSIFLLTYISYNVYARPQLIESATQTQELQSTSVEQVQLTITPIPDLCPRDCRLEGGSTILSFPLSSLDIKNDNSTESEPFVTLISTPIVKVFLNGSETISYITQEIPLPDSLSDLRTTDKILNTKRIWTQFGTELTSPTKYAAYTGIDLFAATLTVPPPGQGPSCIDDTTVFRPAEEDLSKFIIALPEEQGANFLEDDVVPPSILQSLKTLPKFAGVNLEQCQFEAFAPLQELENDRIKFRRALSSRDTAQQSDALLLSEDITGLTFAGRDHPSDSILNATLANNSTNSTDAKTTSVPLTSTSDNSAVRNLVTDIHQSGDTATTTSVVSNHLSSDIDPSLVLTDADLASSSNIVANNVRMSDEREFFGDTGSIASSVFISNQTTSLEIATTSFTAAINRTSEPALSNEIVIFYLPNSSFILVPATIANLTTTFQVTRTTASSAGLPLTTIVNTDLALVREEATDNITATPPFPFFVGGSKAGGAGGAGGAGDSDPKDPGIDVQNLLDSNPINPIEKVSETYLTDSTATRTVTSFIDEGRQIPTDDAGPVQAKPLNEASPQPTPNPAPETNFRPNNQPISVDESEPNPAVNDQPVGDIPDNGPPPDNPPDRNPSGGNAQVNSSPDNQPGRSPSGGNAQVNSSPDNQPGRSPSGGNAQVNSSPDNQPGRSPSGGNAQVNPRPGNPGINRPDAGGSSSPEAGPEPVVDTPNVIIANPPRQNPPTDGGNGIAVAGGDIPQPAPAARVPNPPVGQTLTVAGQPVVVTPAPSINPPLGDRGGGEGIILNESQVVAPGQEATINGIPVSFDAENSAIVVQGRSTIDVSPPPAISSPELVIDVGGEDITVSLAPPVNGQPGGIIIDGTQSLAPGQVTEIGNMPISVPPMGSAIVVDSNTIPITNQASVSAQTIAIGSSSLVVTPQESGGALVIGASQTLVPGEVVNINGVPVSLPASGSSIVIGDGQTVQITGGTEPLLTAQPVLSVGGESFTAMVEGGTTQFVLDSGVTLTPGGAVTVDGTTVSLPADPIISEVIIDGTTSALVAPALITPAPPLIVDGEIFTAVMVGTEIGFEIADGQTLLPGGIAIIDDTTVSLPAGGPGNSVVIIDGATSTFTDTPFVTPSPITINGQIFTATVIDESSTIYSIAPGTTLTPGGIITIDGTIISLPTSASDNSVVIMNGMTSTIPDVVNITPPPAITIDDEVFSATIIGSSTFYSIGPGITLTPGGVVTVDGTRISLLPDATAVVYGDGTGSDSTTSALVGEGPFETDAAGNIIYDGGAAPTSRGVDVTHWLIYALSMLFGGVLLL